MKLALALFLGFFSFASANGTTQIQAFPGKVKVMVDLNMQGLSNTAVDILFVVDNSGSMQAHQQSLAMHAPALANHLLNLGTDFHAAVISTDASNANSKGPGGFEGPIITSSDALAGSKLARQIQLGSQGSGTEEHFKPVEFALSEPLVNGINAGFLRPDADLAIIYLTDAEDQGKGSVTDFVTFLKSLKPHGQKISVQGLIVPSNDVLNCSRDTQNDKPVRIEQVIQEFGGTAFNICDTANYSKNVMTIADSISNVDATTTPVPGTDISRIALPSPAEFDTITVKYGTQIIRAGNMKAGWVYDSSRNELLMGSDIEWSRQPKGTTLDIEYVPVDWVK